MRQNRINELAEFIHNIKTLPPEELANIYAELKAQQDILTEKMKYVREKLLTHFQDPTTLETPTATVKIVKAKRKILDQKALKEAIDITPFLKEQEVTLIQVKFK